jgi:transketolase
VSLPCWRIFDRQPQRYRDDVLPPQVTARLSVEAAATFGWQHYVGDKGASMGIDHFGASAPAEVLFKEFGFTPERVTERALNLLGR